METIAKIRRRHLIQGDSISSIARDFNLSRNTVRKYLQTEQYEPQYQRSHQPKPKLGEYEAILEDWLIRDGYLPKQQRRTARRLFECLQTEGYQGAYDSVQRYVGMWKKSSLRPKSKQAFVPMLFLPGDTCQFDWSYETVELSGEIHKVKVAHFRLAHSRKCFVVAYPRETQEMVMDAHQRAFRFFDGVPKRMVYDNLKTVVDTIMTGKERQFNRRFMALAAHYLFEPVACTPASGWEKGQIENQVGNIREWLFTPCPKFNDLQELNHWLELRCQELAKRPHPTMKQYRIMDVYEMEKPHLIAIQQPFDGYIQHVLRVSNLCLVHFDRNRYSVPAHYAGKIVTVHAYADHIKMIYKHQVIAEHPRQFGRDHLACELWHYLSLAEMKPGAVRHGVPFQELPPAILKVRDKILKYPKGDRAFVELLLAVREHGLEPLQVACELTLQYGAFHPSIVMNELRRLIAPAPPANLDLSEQERWQLHHEPQANINRYDSLLGG